MSVKFIESSKEGRLGVTTPYNADFVKRLKQQVPSAKWNGNAWFFDEISKSDVEELVNEFYPSDDALQKVIITWSHLHRDNPQIDGVSLANVNRDYWNWRNNCPIQFKVISVDIESGGSRKSPGLYGSLTIEARIRPNASISPKPDSIEIIENGQEFNPLAKFSTEELLAELKKRGIK